MSSHPPPSRLATLPAPTRAWFRHVRILLPCPYAARRPVPIASTNAEVILGLSFSWHADDGRVSRCDRNTHCHHRQSAHAHQAPCGGPDQLAPCSLHAAVAGGLQPTSVSAPSSRAAARMSGGTDLGHRRRPGPRLARAAPVTPILLGFGRGTPGFHPEGCAGFNSRSSELKPAQPWELKPAAGIRTSTGTDADAGSVATSAHSSCPFTRPRASPTLSQRGRQRRVGRANSGSFAADLDRWPPAPIASVMDPDWRLAS